MKKTLSIRAMLISLFLAAVLGAVVLAATGWTTNQRLIDSQRYITNEVLPLQDASMGMVLTMGAFGQRHADLLAAGSVNDLNEVTTQSALDARFRDARKGLQGVDQAQGLSDLDSHYETLLEGDTALEAVRREELSLQTQMAERISAMQALISQVMLSAEDIAGRTALAQVRSDREQRELMEAWREDGMTTLPTQLLDNMFTAQADIGRLSGNARMALAQLSDLGRQMMQTDSADALVNLRHNEIAQQVGLARQSLAAIADAPSTEVDQRALISDLDAVIVELDGLMVSDDNAVYELRLQQLELNAQVQAAR